MKRNKELLSGTWRILRALVREKQQTGAELRSFLFTRKTKDGSFFAGLVANGLIEAVAVSKGDLRTQPVEHRTVYKLTELGRHAAEYGEYEYEWQSPVKKGKAK